MTKKHNLLLIFFIVHQLGLSQSSIKFENDFPADYDSYYKMILPIIGQSYNSINKLGFIVSKIHIDNYINGNHSNFQNNYREIAGIWFRDSLELDNYQSFKRWILFNFKDSIGLETVKKSYLYDWKNFSFSYIQNGYLGLFVILMNDSIQTLNKLNRLYVYQNKVTSELPSIFFKPVNIEKFIYSLTKKSLNNNKWDSFYRRIDGFTYHKDAAFYKYNDSIIEKYTKESIEISIQDSISRKDYIIRLFDNNNDFLLPIDSYFKIVEKVKYPFISGYITRLKIQLIPTGQVLGGGFIYCMEDSYVDYFILNYKEYTIQVEKANQLLNHNFDNNFNISEVEKLFSEIMEFIK